MKTRSAMLGLILFLTGGWANGQVTAAPTQPLPVRKLFIHPTSTSVAGGKASLTISPLRRKATTYIGEYAITVTPYFFKNETGKLSVTVSEESLQKLIQGMPVDFTGSATTDGEKKARLVSARAIPIGAEHGSVTFSVANDERKITFKSEVPLSRRVTEVSAFVERGLMQGTDGLWCL